MLISKVKIAWYNNLWHSMGMITKLFVESSLFFYLHPLHCIVRLSFICSTMPHIKWQWQVVYPAELCY